MTSGRPVISRTRTESSTSGAWAGTALSPQWMKRPKRASRHHYIRASCSAFVSAVAAAVREKFPIIARMSINKMKRLTIFSSRHRQRFLVLYEVLLFRPDPELDGFSRVPIFIHKDEVIIPQEARPRLPVKNAPFRIERRSDWERPEFGADDKTSPITLGERSSPRRFGRDFPIVRGVPLILRIPIIFVPKADTHPRFAPEEDIPPKKFRAPGLEFFACLRRMD